MPRNRFWQRGRGRLLFVPHGLQHKEKSNYILFSRVADPYSFDTDPDPAFKAEYRSGSGSRGFDEQKTKKNYSWKKILIFFINYNLPIPRPPYRTSKLQKKPSALKREHPALINMKFFNFFFILVVIFAFLDPDSEYGSGSATLCSCFLSVWSHSVSFLTGFCSHTKVSLGSR